jgi:hypothetical protein
MGVLREVVLCLELEERGTCRHTLAQVPQVLSSSGFRGKEFPSLSHNYNFPRVADDE